VDVSSRSPAGPATVTSAETRAAWLIVGVSAAYLALGFVWGSTRDEEEYRISIATTLLHARGLASGHWAFWTSALGLGQPHPLGQSFIWHPLMPLLAWLRLDQWVVLLLGSHLILGAAGMMWLARLLGLRPLAAAAATATFLLGSTTQNFLLTDFWPSGFIGWTLMPCVLGSMLRLLAATARDDQRRWALLLGLVSGCAVVNGHPGYMLVFAIPVLTFLAANHRRVLDQWGWWILAAAVALAVAAPAIAHLGPEVRRFPAGLERANYDNPIRWAGLWDVFIRPIPMLTSGSGWQATFERGTRVLFFGSPFAVLAGGALLASGWRRQAHRGLLPAFVVSFVLLSTPGLTRVQALPATFLFRDPVILFGGLLAAVVVNRWWVDGRRWLAGCVIAAQCIVLAAATWPFLEATLNPARLQTWRIFAAPGSAVAWVTTATRGAPGRLYYSAQVDRMVERAELVDVGLWRNSPAYHGLRVANGSFKGISIDEVSPSQLSLYGSFRSVEPLQLSAPSLGTLGLRYILALEGEPVAEGLRTVSTFSTPGGVRLVLYGFAEATGTVVVDADAAATEVPLLPGCPHRRLVCRDFSRLWSSRQTAAAPQVTGDHGVLTVELAAPAPGGVVVIAELFRPGWKASADGRPLVVRPVVGGLIGVNLPTAATRRIELHYRPWGRIAALLLAAAATLLAVGLACRRRRPDPSATGT
jgi:hypothetical protein